MKASAIVSTLSLGLLASVGHVAASRSPVLAFSQAGTRLLPNLAPSSSIDSFVAQLGASASSSELCSLDAVVVVAADNLKRSTFSSLRHASPSLRQAALDAPSQLTFDAVGASSSTELETKLSDAITKACGTRPEATQLTLGQQVLGDELTKGSIVHIKVADLEQQEESLLQTLAEVNAAYPRNLVVVASAGDRSLFKRQFSTLGGLDSAKKGDDNGTWTEPEGSIFARYQLFSTAQILTLLVVLGVLLPAAFIVIGQLAGVQVPDQIGVRKDPITGDKKQQ